MPRVTEELVDSDCLVVGDFFAASDSEAEEESESSEDEELDAEEGSLVAAAVLRFLASESSSDADSSELSSLELSSLELLASLELSESDAACGEEMLADDRCGAA